MRDGLSVVRPRSGLLTTSVRELITVCKGGYFREIVCQVDLYQSYNLYAIFRTTTKPSSFNLFFNILFPFFSPLTLYHVIEGCLIISLFLTQLTNNPLLPSYTTTADCLAHLLFYNICCYILVQGYSS